MKLQKDFLGEIYHDSEILVLFGNQQLSTLHYRKDLEKLCEQEVPSFYVHQVHGDGIAIVDESFQIGEEADALLCDTPYKALLVKTADCIPVAVYHKKSGKIAMVHAGWRGVHNDILIKTLKLIDPEEKNKESFLIWMGPHIQKSSFQIGEDVLELFRRKFSLREMSEFLRDLENEGKYFLDLSKILENRLIDFGIPSSNICISQVDTFSKVEFHSFRREPLHRGRNLNFILKKSL